LAKQLGVSDAALAGLQDPARHPFPPDQKTALLFADAMTDGPGHVPDDVYDELKRHWSEPQIVEIACVVGLFNYFNRFNNALHVEITLMDPDVLARRVEQTIAAADDPAEMCDRVAGMLRQGRRYRRVEIRRTGTAPSIPASSALGILVVPIQAVAGPVGIIEVEADRDQPFDDEERPLLERVARILSSRLVRC
jgi:hypothetical protein